MPVTNPTPSLSSPVQVDVAQTPPLSATAIGVLVGPDGPVPGSLEMDRDRLAALGFDGNPGSTLVLHRGDGPSHIVVGIGKNNGADDIRTAAAFATAALAHSDLALELANVPTESVRACAEAAVEGLLLARYGYDALRSSPRARPVSNLTIVVAAGDESAAQAGASTGRTLAGATALARDLANTPHNHLTATRLAEIAVDLGNERGLEVEVFDESDLAAMEIGGLLAINAGSVEPPRMIRLTYEPANGESTGRLALVGKGVMYDSGGLGIKPNDRVHAQMKNDMSGAAAVLAAMGALRDLGCTTSVTGYLVCTDNMPSGSAIALGDVITIRGGKTVEVMDTDAEGRVVMSDALVLAVEAGHDAIVDIATLTGACLRALGPDVAGLFGNTPTIIDQVLTASSATGEPVWELPLYRPYREHLNSLVADIANVSYGEAGAITAALFLAEFVGNTPWAHLDIAGTSQVNSARSWLPEGCSGFGARLLAQLAVNFVPVA